MSFEYEMGVRARDEITGFEGVITARYEFINGCKRYGLEALHEGDVKELVFDEDRLVGVDVAVDIAPSRTGGPRSAPPRTGAR